MTRNIIEVEMNVAQYKKIVEDLKKRSKKDRQRERLFEEIGASIFQNLQENWEVQQSLNGLNELQTQNEGTNEESSRKDPKRG